MEIYQAIINLLLNLIEKLGADSAIGGLLAGIVEKLPMPY